MDFTVATLLFLFLANLFLIKHGKHEKSFEVLKLATISTKDCLIQSIYVMRELHCLFVTSDIGKSF